MSELSFVIESIESTDYDDVGTVTDKMVRPYFDGVIYNNFGGSYPTTTSDADCKTDIKVAMTAKGIERTSEV